MYIEKNAFNNFFNTMIDIKGKSKDNIKARMDLREYCKQLELEFVDIGNGRIYKLKAKFSFTIDHKCIISEWVKKFRNVN